LSTSATKDSRHELDLPQIQTVANLTALHMHYNQINSNNKNNNNNNRNYNKCNCWFIHKEVKAVDSEIFTIY